MEAMAHRNRWFTVLKNGGSFHGKLLNNQMVCPMDSNGFPHRQLIWVLSKKNMPGNVMFILSMTIKITKIGHSQLLSPSCSSFSWKKTYHFHSFPPIFSEHFAERNRWLAPRGCWRSCAGRSWRANTWSPWDPSRRSPWRCNPQRLRCCLPWKCCRY